MSEYITALGILLNNYNTTIYENRFLVGGALEVFTILLLQEAGIPAQPYGDETADGDIILPRRKLLSVKGSFTQRTHSIRLINTMGDTMPVWNTATLFVLSGVGIVYGDPQMIEPNEDLTKSKDALLLNSHGLKKIMADQKNIFPMPIPTKPDSTLTQRSLKASAAVAKQIIIEERLDTLRSYFS